MQIFFLNLNGRSVCAQLVDGFTLKDFLYTAGKALGHRSRDETLGFRYTVSSTPLNVMNEEEFDSQKQYITEGCNIFTLGRLLGGWALSDTLQEIAEQQLQDELGKVVACSAECSICLDSAVDCIREPEYIATLQAMEEEKQLLRNMDCERCHDCGALMLNETMSVSMRP
ncbi:hypothetical protein EC957_006888 [Mortierella hygrophila]|uniref:Uncharacterized protein n=1 Tax=Mortierella hygrophila TaxID=979708 RepID=A0A9P6EYR8_9FUNG|nr:hypothetical protein EC957_006888 [Mortierella hygrophila]